MIKILIAEDNRSYAEDVADFLQENGYQAQIVPNAAEMWAALAADYADIVLLDLGLPDEDGFTIVPQLRKLYPDKGLIVLTARVSTDNRIQGLRLGADIYLTKPIKFAELAANIEALNRRMRPSASREQSPWRLRIDGRLIEYEGKGSLAITEKEFNFLHLLAQNRQPVPRNSLVIGMGENKDLDATGKMDMFVYRLRLKIKNSLGVELPLRSEYGKGYSLAVPFKIT